MRTRISYGSIARGSFWSFVSRTEEFAGFANRSTGIEFLRISTIPNLVEGSMTEYLISWLA